MVMHGYRNIRRVFKLCPVVGNYIRLFVVSCHRGVCVWRLGVADSDRLV